MRTMLGLTVMLMAAQAAHGQSLWERRNPYFANMMTDYRARNVGDLLTIVVNENTESQGLEVRAMEKKTKANAIYAFSGKTASDNASRSFSADFAGSGDSQRKFDGTNNSTIDRKFLDRMTVTVVGVLPNGNLLVEGYRQRMVTRELRTLRVRGVVRPADIGAFNTVQSAFIADFDVAYSGSGPESSYTNQGWWGRMWNVLWPY